MSVTPTTWNPADKDAAGTLSGGNLTHDGSSGSVRSVYSATAGKYYWEVIYPVAVGVQLVGVATSSASVDDWPGGDAFGWTFESNSGNICTSGSVVATSGLIPVTTLSVLLDADAKELRFWADGVDCGVVTSITGTAFYAVVGYIGKTTANFGATAFNHTPPVGYEVGFGVPYPNSNSIASFGTPAVIRGPNRTAQAVGGVAFSSGVHHAQLGYPASVVPEGVSVFSAGTPEALPYAVKILPVPGASVFGAGRPMAVADPIATAYTTVVAVGASVFSAGTPTSASAAAVQVAGASVFKSGTATASPVVNAVGASLFRAGTPVAAQTARPVGVSVFGAGTPSVTMLAFPLGVSVFRAGTPRTGAAGSVAASGASTFSAGTPKTSVCVHARGQSLFRSGRPSIDRGATC